jgi:hypothetical protein
MHVNTQELTKLSKGISQENAKKLFGFLAGRLAAADRARVKAASAMRPGWRPARACTASDLGGDKLIHRSVNGTLRARFVLLEPVRSRVA